MVEQKNGETLLVSDPDVPNNKIMENLYQRYVNQKVNYAFGKPFKIILSEPNDEYQAILDKYFNFDFFMLMQSLATDAINCAFGWLMPYINNMGQLEFIRLSPIGVIPDWEDREHTKLNSLTRAYYSSEPTLPQTDKLPTMVEVYQKDMMYRYIYLKDNFSKYMQGFENNYINIADEYYNWGEVPIIPFKANSNEVPLIRNIKSAQDALNLLLSLEMDEMQSSNNGAIFVVSGYSQCDETGAKISHDIKVHHVAKVGENGDIKMLQPTMNTDSYQKTIKELRKTITSSCNALDMETLQNLSQHANEISIKTTYAALDADTDALFTSFQKSLHQVLRFINKYLILTRQFKKEFANIEVEFKFTKNQLINESERIDNIRKLKGIVSDETLLENVPMVSDVAEELERLRKQKEEEIELNGMFEHDEQENEEFDEEHNEESESEK